MPLRLRSLWFAVIAGSVVLASCYRCQDGVTVRTIVHNEPAQSNKVVINGSGSGTVITVSGKSGWEMSSGITGTGPIVTQERRVSRDFHAIAATGAFDLRIVGDGRTSVEVAAQDNIQAIVETKVEDGVLRISATKSFNVDLPVQVVIYRKGLHRIDLSGAASCTAIDMDVESLSIDAEGASSAAFAGRARQLQVTAEGASAVDTSGLESERLTAQAEGASRLILGGSCRQTHLTAEGASTISAEKLDSAATVLVAGGASTIHMGRAGQVSQESSGASTITIDGHQR